MAAREKWGNPFFYRGGETGCLLLHGFAGSPGEMEPLGIALSEAGLTVSCPVLAGHCDPGSMETAGWKDWRQSALDSLVDLRSQASRIFVVGFSLGGLIAYDLASSEPVKGVVSINTPIKLVSRQMLRAHLLKMARTGGFLGSATEPSLDRVPMSCLSAFYDYTGRVEDLLPQVKVPALIIQSKEDQAINPGDAKLIRDALGCKEKRIAWIEGAGHLSVLEEKLSVVFKEIHAFIIEHAGKADQEMK